MVDLITEVNVEFMLCPSSAMAAVFSLAPAVVLQPSYRTPLTLVVFIVGTMVSYTYIGVSKLLRRLVTGGGAQDKKSKKTV